MIDARVEKAIVTTLEPHRKKVTERIDDESVRTNALIKDRITAQAGRCSNQDERNYWSKDPAQRMRTQTAKDFEENRSTLSGGSPGLKNFHTRSPAGRMSKVSGKQQFNDDLTSQVSFK